MKDWLFLPGTGLIGMVVSALGGADVMGLERLPRKGACIVVSNHVSDVDPPILAWALGYRSRRVIYFMAKDEMRRWPVVGWLVSRAGVFYVRRGEADRAAQRQALALLRRGDAIAVFPEGTRSRDGRLQAGNPGVALLAIRSGAPVVPVSILGTQRILPPGGRMIHRSRVTVQVGEALRLPHRPTGRVSREELAFETERVMRTIAALLPRELRGPHG